MASNALAWLAHITEMLGAEASGMLSVHPNGEHSLIANGHRDSAISQYRDHFRRLDPLPQRLKARPELCNDYLRPHCIDHVIATQWQQADGTLHVVGVQRFHGSEPFSVGQGQALDRFIHHWRVGNALPLPEGLAARPPYSRRSCDIASQINIPLAVVNAAAHENPGLTRLALFEKPGDTSAQTKLRKRMKALVSTSLRQRSASEALINASDDTWFVTAAPVAGKPNLALLRLTAMHHVAPGIRSRLEHLYGLTRAVKIDAVRTQLRTVYKKTGAHRHGELVCLAGMLGNG